APKITANPRIRNLIRHCIVPTAARKVRSRFISTRTVPTRIAILTILPAGRKPIQSCGASVRVQTSNSSPRNPSKAANGKRTTISRYCGNGKGGAQRRGNKGQSRFRGHSRWFTESCDEVISSEPVKPAILTQNASLVERG